MSKTIEIQPIEGTKTGDLVVKVAGVERLRFGPLDGVPLDLCHTVVFQEQSSGKYAAMVSDDFDVSKYLPAGTPCVETPPMPADAPKGKIEQELETMAAKLDMILLCLGSGGQVGQRLSDLEAAQIRHEEQMRRLREDLVRWQRLSGGEVTRLEVRMEEQSAAITQMHAARAEKVKKVQEFRQKMTHKLIRDPFWPMKGNGTEVTGVTPVPGDSSTDLSAGALAKEDH